MDIGIIGCGNVGATCAFLLLHSSSVDSVRIYDKNSKLTKGVCADLEDAAYIQKKTVSQSDMKNLFNSDVIIITAGRNQMATQKRNDLFGQNITVVESIIQELKGYRGKIIIVTNPVDTICSYLRERYRDLDIVSTGTRLDTVRLHRITNGIGEIRGSHDDSQVAVIDGKIDESLSLDVRRKAYEIIENCGSTKYGISEVLKEMVENIQKEKINDAGKQ